MVFFGSGQIDDDGLKVKSLVERAFAEIGKPVADFLTIVQGESEEHSDPVVTIRTPHGLRAMKVTRTLLYERSEDWLLTQIKRRVEAMYRRPAA